MRRLPEVLLATAASLGTLACEHGTALLPNPSPVAEVRAPADAATLPLAEAVHHTSGDIENARFAGHDREVAKTSLSTAAPETFDSVNDLLASLPTDHLMRHHDPALTRDPDCLRVTEEERNVIVSGWIYAAKLENGAHGDMDFHLILASKPESATEEELINTEVSALPDISSADYQTLRRARRQFIHDVAGNRVPGGTYKRYDESPEGPIHVEVHGSLFYDVDHPAGQVGPTGLRPKTAWEIHPVSSISLIP